MAAALTLYVESNYILELAFQQEQHDACREILRHATAKELELVVPAFCIGEPYEKVIRQRIRRAELQRSVLTEVKEMRRSSAYSGIDESTKEFTGLLIASGEQELQRLHDALLALLAAATVIPLDATIVTAAIQAHRSAGMKSPQDAIVFASVIGHLPDAVGERLFLNRNAKDFLVPEVEAELSGLGCKLLTSFDDGLAWIKARLPK